LYWMLGSRANKALGREGTDGYPRDLVSVTVFDPSSRYFSNVSSSTRHSDNLVLHLALRQIVLVALGCQMPANDENARGGRCDEPICLLLPESAKNLGYATHHTIIAVNVFPVNSPRERSTWSTPDFCTLALWRPSFE
jgi:hypothetical protein